MGRREIVSRTTIGWPRPTVVAGYIVGLSIFSTVSAYADPIPVRLPNLRSQRTPTKPWTIETSQLLATVKPTTRQGSWVVGRWSLDIRLEGNGQPVHVLAVLSDSIGVRVSPVDRRAGVTPIHLDIDAPRFCPSTQTREPITITVQYLFGARVESVKLDVDHRCLLGDIIPRIDAASYATLARKYTEDPVIVHLANRANEFEPRSLTTEVARLRSWVGFDGDSIQPDPPDMVSGWSTGTAYALSPTETVRLGGDCEDWTILISAYLARRGFSVSLQQTFGHVWTRARDANAAGTELDIDWIEQLPLWRPNSVAAVLPLRKVEPMCLANF